MSRYTSPASAAEREAEIAGQLRTATDRGWPLVMHPDAITDFGAWREYGPLVCIENMDKRKPIGRSEAASQYSVAGGRGEGAYPAIDKAL